MAEFTLSEYNLAVMSEDMGQTTGAVLGNPKYSSNTWL